MSSSSAVRRPKEIAVSGGSKVTTVQSSKPFRSITPVSERIISRGVDSTGKENANSYRATSRIRAAFKPQKPFVPPNSSVNPRGRSSSPSEFNRVTSDVRKPRVSRVSIDRNDRSVSVGRSTRVSDKSSQQNKVPSKFPNCNESKQKPKTVKTQGVKVNKVSPKFVREKEIVLNPESMNTQCSSGSIMKVSESVTLVEKFKSKSCVGLTSNNGLEVEENGVRLSFSNSSGKLSSRGNSLDGSKEKGASEASLSVRSSGKYPSKLHGKLAFLEEKVKKIAIDIKRTKEMLDLNNPGASKVMLSDIQETVAGIEKAMGDVVGEKEKMGLIKVNESDNIQINVVKKNTPVKESSGTKSLAKGLNTDELEARFFPHHKLLRDRSTRKAPTGSHEPLKTEVLVAVVTESKQEEKCLAPVLSNSLSKGDSKVTIRDGLEICEVQETDSTVSSKACVSSSTYIGKGNVDIMLTADESLEEFDDEDIKTITVFEEEMDDSFNNQLSQIGHKTSTGGWFVSEGESVLLAHDDGSCTFYDVANSEEKSIYKPPVEFSPNLWRDCWILRAPGADGCSGRYVVAASAGNSTDSGFCSWDFYTKEVKSFHIENGVTNTRTALAPLPNNVLNQRHDPTNLNPENRQWWYKPCGPLIISTASNQKVVRIYDIRDGEHVMKWELQNDVVAMDNSSPLQWRNRGKVVLAEADCVSLWDVGSLTPEPLLSVSCNGKRISALHVNNTDAELGGGVRQRVNSSESEGNDGVFCTSDSINILDFRHPSGIALKIPKSNTTVHSVFSRGDSIYLGCTPSPSSSQIQHFSLRKQNLFNTYILPESNAHQHYKSITQVWGNSNTAIGVCGLGLFVFDAMNDDCGNGQKIREIVGPDNLYCPSFDYLGSRALVISGDRPAVWKYLS